MDTEETSSPIVYHGRRGLELGAAGFFLLIFLISIVDSAGPGFFSWLLTGAMGFNGLYFLRRALDRRPRLVLDEEGIRDLTSVSGSELFLPWSEIEAVAPSIGKDMVEVKVRDLDRIRGNTGWLRAQWLRFRRLWGKKTVTILVGMIPPNKGELTAAIEEGIIAFERKQLGFPAEAKELPAPE
jgi:hypothetical protein